MNRKENWKRTALRGFDELCTATDLFGRYIGYNSRTVRQDEGVKRLVQLTIFSAFTPNPINLFLRGETSIGKTLNAVTPLQFFCDELKKKHVWLLGGLSPTALVHNKANFVDVKGSVVDWNDKPSRGKVKQELRDSYSKTETKLTKEMVDQAFRQAKREWDERISEGHYEVDLKDKILVFLDAPHMDTYNKLRPILSHDAKEISYRFTDKTRKGRLQTTHVVIKGWPATIFCSSDETFVNDLATRSFNITPETSDAKLSEALGVTAEKRVNPWKFDRDEEWVELESYLRWWIRAVKEYRCLVPYARELKGLFPLYGPRVMRDFDHFLTLIEVAALFRFCQRPLIKREQEKVVLATLADFNTVLSILPDFEESTITGLPRHILDCFHKAIEPLFEDEGAFTYRQLTDKYNETFEEKRSGKTIYGWVQKLSEIGWVTTYHREEGDKRKVLVKVIKNSENSLVSSLRKLPTLFSLETLENVINEVKNYSPSDITLYNTVLDEGPCSIETLYCNHFQGEYFVDDEKAEIQVKTEKTPRKIPLSQTSTEIGIISSKTYENNTFPICCLCNKPIPLLHTLTNIDGKPCHKQCKDDIKT